MNKLYIKSSGFAEKTEGIEKIFDVRQLRRADNFIKLNLLAAAKALGNAGINLTEDKYNIGLIIASGRGPIKQTCNFMDSIIVEGDIMSSPMAFSSSVHNAVETAVTNLLHFRGPCVTISQGGTSLSSALVTAKSWLLSRRCDYVFLGVADELHPVMLSEYEHKINKSEHASYFLLTLEETEDEFIADETVDEYNPSLHALNMAKKNIPFVDEEDIKKIVPDFIKTYLARQKTEVMQVFENPDTKEMLKDVSQQDKNKILNDLKLFCLIDTFAEIPNSDIEQACHESFKKNKSVNFLLPEAPESRKTAFIQKKWFRKKYWGFLFFLKNAKERLPRFQAIILTDLFSACKCRNIWI